MAAAGSYAFGERFYFGGYYKSSVIDYSGVVTSPIATDQATGTFDLVGSNLAIGYVHKFGDAARFHGGDRLRVLLLRLRLDRRRELRSQGLGRRRKRRTALESAKAVRAVRDRPLLGRGEGRPNGASLRVRHLDQGGLALVLLPEPWVRVGARERRHRCHDDLDALQLRQSASVGNGMMLNYGRLSAPPLRSGSCSRACSRSDAAHAAWDFVPDLDLRAQGQDNPRYLPNNVPARAPQFQQENTSSASLGHERRDGHVHRTRLAGLRPGASSLINTPTRRTTTSKAPTSTSRAAANTSGEKAVAGFVARLHARAPSRCRVRLDRFQPRPAESRHRRHRAHGLHRPVPQVLLGHAVFESRRFRRATR